MDPNYFNSKDQHLAVILEVNMATSEKVVLAATVKVLKVYTRKCKVVDTFYLENSNEVFERLMNILEDPTFDGQMILENRLAYIGNGIFNLSRNQNSLCRVTRHLPAQIVDEQ